MNIEEFIDAVVTLDEKRAIDFANELLNEGMDPSNILEALHLAPEEIGKKFEKGEYFISDLIMAGEILKEITALIKPKLSSAKRRILGRIVIGTVEGDIHDIGKNIAIALLESAGFEVLDLGVDVPAEKFVEAIKNFQPEIVGMSGLLTVAIESMKKVVEKIKETSLREKVKIIIGGGRMNEDVMHYVGADTWTDNAVRGVKLCKQLLLKEGGSFFEHK
ncbi:MAG: cobalamin-dependent protein [Candidatus Bathyarchaeia archaeon]